MTKSTYSVLFLILIHFASFAMMGPVRSDNPEDKDWKLEKSENGIRIYSRTDGSSKFKEIKVLCEIEGTLSQFYAFFIDVDNYEDVIKGTEVAKLIDRPTPFELLYYTEIDLPWPASNRDLTIQANIDVAESGEKMIIRAENKKGIEPVNSSIVRIPYWRAVWEVRKKDESHLDIEYFFKVDPGGSLPAWIVNETVPKSTYQTFLNLEKNLKLPRYQDKSYSFIDS